MALTKDSIYMADKRIVKLTEAQIKEIRNALETENAMTEAVWRVFEHMSEAITKRRNDVWDQIHELCGTSQITHELTVRLIAGDVVISERELSEDEESE